MDYKVKDTITKENIIKDLKTELKSHIKYSFLLICIYIFLLFTASLACKPITSNLSNQTLVLIVYILLICMLLLIIFYSCYLVYLYFTIQYSYTILTNRLVEIVPKKIFSTQRKDTIPFRFTAHGKFVISYRRRYYLWSKNYCMNGDSIINSTNLNEDFYTIVVNKKIWYIYNKKMFVLADDITK